MPLADVHKSRPETWTLTARWLFPVDRPPLQHGTITITGERIVAVEPRGVRTADMDLGNVALLPGLVNAHTHLDLSGLRGQCPPTPEFTDWLRAVIRHRRSRTEEETAADIRIGLAESIHTGTTLIGDITAGGASWAALSSSSLRAVVFCEVIGLLLPSATAAIETMDVWLKAHPPTSNCRRAISPHAPYSVRDRLFTAAGKATHLFGYAVATHLAETTAELDLLEHQRGPFSAFLQELGVWDPFGLVSGPRQVIETLSQAPVALFAHANYLKPDMPIPAHGSIVYCPRTHAAFGHPLHPFRDFLARGVRIALGTDSLASNPDLDLLAEARFVHQKYPDVPGDTLLRMATLSGAEALGWADETGSLTPGKSADIVVLPLPNEETADPHDLIFASALPVQAVLFRGSWSCLRLSKPC